tara:strand:- start:101 stop:628 length:528 start_codon:yes stop_codon:yes gene_type:complete
MSNLRLINETTVSSSVASINVTDVFSADYDIYKIVFDNFFADGQDLINLSFINSSGSEVRGSSDYAYADLNCQTNASFTESKDSSNDDIQGFAVIGSSAGESANGVLYVFNPFNSSSYTFITQQNSSIRASVNQNKKGIGVLLQTSSIKGFSFFIHGTDSFTSGVIRTYGLRVDS